ncbi:receptor-like protein 1 [Quercus suber]|uniref:Receptor-like protein 1 n=1 Tax=Quercus suber TaxID=58331 RepID=A0AAW0IML0_QUESU
MNSLIELQLGGNQLSGRIPNMPAKLQIALNLSSNHLEGSIPITLSQLIGLEVLDLSNNSLSGEIPTSLTTMTSLTQLILANNMLSWERQLPPDSPVVELVPQVSLRHHLLHSPQKNIFNDRKRIFKCFWTVVSN